MALQVLQASKQPLAETALETLRFLGPLVASSIMYNDGFGCVIRGHGTWFRWWWLLGEEGRWFQ
jgi:hypothetical protein